MDFITGAISDVLDKAERDATAKFDELTEVTNQQGAEIAKQLCLIRAELAGIRMAIVDAAAAGGPRRDSSGHAEPISQQ
jgi:hypothetical protein